MEHGRKGKGLAREEEETWKLEGKQEEGSWRNVDKFDEWKISLEKHFFPFSIETRIKKRRKKEINK